jgi:hypothetical protein
VGVGVCVAPVVVGVAVASDGVTAPPTLTQPLTALTCTDAPPGEAPRALLFTRTDVPLAVAAMRNLHVYSNEPSGIGEVFSREYTRARILVHPGPGVHPIGK